MTDLPEGVPARAAALDMLHAALARRAGLDDALARPPFSTLPPRERGQARALVMATLRNLGPIDRALAGKLNKPPPEMVLNLLRIGAAQLYYMEAPDFAVVSTSVDLAAGRQDTRPFKGLVNAVLRALARDGKPDFDAEALCPDWLLARWKAAWGPADALAIAAMIAQEPSADLSVRDPAVAQTLAEALEARPLPGGSWRTDKGGAITEWPGFDDGAWWMQDAAAAIPARLLGAGPGQTAIDLCAAPGGKTLQLAASGATVTALDRHRHLPPPSGRAVGQPPRRRRPPGQDSRHPAGRRRQPREARRTPGLLRLFAGAGGGRGPGRPLPVPPSELPAGADRAGRGRGAGRQRHAERNPARAAVPPGRRRRRLLRRAVCQKRLEPPPGLLAPAPDAL